MRSERIVAALAGAAAVVLAAIAPPDPAGPLRLAGAALLGAGAATLLLWAHPCAPLVAAALLAAGLAIAPAPEAPLWALAPAFLALLALALATAREGVRGLAPALGVGAAGALLAFGLGALLPRLSVAAAPLAFLAGGLLLLALAAIVALARHGGAEDPTPPQG